MIFTPPPRRFDVPPPPSRPKPKCPVCLKPVDRLVRHHDHFHDLCTMLFWSSLHKFAPEFKWETFDEMEICHECNMICVWVKRERQDLPRWVSFSPYEMAILRHDPDLSALPAIWRSKKQQYQERIKKLLELGVPREDIEKAWHDRSPQSLTNNNADANRKEMLEKLNKVPEIKQLTELPNQEEILASLIQPLDWTFSNLNSFIYWYSRKHGDPGCKNNKYGIQQSKYTRWWIYLAQGKKEEADELLQYALYWKRVNEGKQPNIPRPKRPLFL